MLVNFWQSAELRETCDISFSYRDNEAYAAGLRQRAEIDFQVYPLRLPDIASMVQIPTGAFKNWMRVLNALLGVILFFPFFIFDVVVLLRLFRRIRPDILHINNGGYPGALSARAAAVAAKLCGVKAILMVINNMAVPYANYSRRLDYLIDRVVVRCVDIYVTGSKAAANQLAKVLRLRQEKLLPLHNGIARRKFEETSEQTRTRLGVSDFNGVLFGVVALMEERKGHRILLDALLVLSRTKPELLADIKILFEGSGPLREELESFVETHALSKQVEFAGVERNIFDFIQALDVLVLPSIRNEDFPNVILEAMSLGKPVIASILAGTPEQVLHGETGMLTTPGDSISLADALAKMVSDGAFRSELGNNALARFEELFVVKKAVKRYLNLYKKMIGESL